MKKFLGMYLILASAGFAAQFIITVTPTLGPVSTSPNYNAWAQNVVNSLILNSAQGPVSTSDPQNFSALPNGGSLNGSLLISSTFNSWKGVANPGGLLTSEQGTALYFALEISGDQNNQFTLNQLGAQGTFLGQTQTPVIPGDFADGSNSGVFNATKVGQRAAGGFTGGGDTGNTPLVALWFIGLAYSRAVDPALLGTDQAKLDATAAAIGALVDRTTTACYSLGTAASGCGSVNVLGTATGVPEPGTVGLLAAGLVGMVQLRRRRG